MNLVYNCIPCILNSLIKLLDAGVVPASMHETAVRRLLDYLAKADYRQSPPALGRDLHRLIRQIVNSADPYQSIKEEYNRLMLAHYPRFQEMVAVAADPFAAAVRLAVAGNAIDFGPQQQFDVMAAIDRVMREPLKIDHISALKKELDRASSVLYIGDNCGEIVLDRLLIETMQHDNVLFAVRGGPIINDATLEDAQAIELDRLTHLITTGDDAPGAVWQTASEEFKNAFTGADVVIAKGQGNLEGLMGIDKKIYFLLMIKCDLIGEQIGARTGDFIVYGMEPATASP
ncbi:DUF89 family protein [candidate division KSB1 bacterium]|nr:DUF89 family protein [candidate division KSB1 bacterium]